VDAPADRVRKHLHLHVAGAQDEALQDEAVVAERGRGLGARGGERGGQLGRAPRNLHPFAPAAGDRFDEQGEADGRGLGQEAGEGRRGGRRAHPKKHLLRPPHPVFSHR
jgi:hypothetical protein